jgi:hypothetical protein
MAHLSRLILAENAVGSEVAPLLADLLGSIDALNADARAEAMDAALALAVAPAKKPLLVRRVSDDAAFVMDLTSKETQAARALAAADGADSSYHRFLVETEHPYVVAARKQWDLVFPSDCNVSPSPPTRPTPRLPPPPPTPPPLPCLARSG